MIADTPVIQCEVVRVSDADTVICADRTRIRLAGVNARERDGSCNHEPCPVMRHEQAKPIAERLMLGRVVPFRIVGRNGKRLVGDNLAVRCALFRSGAALPWTEYVIRYRLSRCPA